MKLARDIMSLSTFKRDSNKVMRQLKKTKEPVVLASRGRKKERTAENFFSEFFAKNNIPLD